MMKTRSFFYLSLLAFVFSACEKIEKIEDFPLESPKLTVNCNLTQSNPMTFYVSKSLSVIDNAEIKPITNAKISLYKDNVFLEELSNVKSDSAGNPVYVSTFKPISGSAYSIVAEAPKLSKVSSTTTLPMPVTLDSIALTIKDSVSFYNIFYSSLNINDAIAFLKFRDDGNMDNYYMISLESVSNFFGGISENNQVQITSSVSGAETINNVIFMNDQNFNGKEISLKFNWRADIPLENAPDDEIYLRVKITSLNKDMYLYQTSYNTYLNNQDNPFAEPVQVYSNMQGGYGIFGGSALNTYEYRIK